MILIGYRRSFQLSELQGDSKKFQRALRYLIDLKKKFSSKQRKI